MAIARKFQGRRLGPFRHLPTAPCPDIIGLERGQPSLKVECDLAEHPRGRKGEAARKLIVNHQARNIADLPSRINLTIAAAPEGSAF